MPEELKLEEVVVKEIADLSDEEKALLKEKKEELTPEQKEKFKSVLEEEGEEKTE